MPAGGRVMARLPSTGAPWLGLMRKFRPVLGGVGRPRGAVPGPAGHDRSLEQITRREQERAARRAVDRRGGRGRRGRGRRGRRPDPRGVGRGGGGGGVVGVGGVVVVVVWMVVVVVGTVVVVVPGFFSEGTHSRPRFFTSKL